MNILTATPTRPSFPQSQADRLTNARIDAHWAALDPRMHDDLMADAFTREVAVDDLP